MPCRSCGSVDPSSFQGGSFDDSYLRDKVNRLKDRTKELEAALCALINELSTQLDEDEFYGFLKLASENGKIDLTEWINKHREEDKKRLKEEVLNKLSDHEIELIKELLK